MAEENTPDRNHMNKAKPAKNYGEAGWGEGVTTAGTSGGAEKLTVHAQTESKVGFSGAVHRRIRKGIIGKILDIIGGKDPDIFDAYGRVRHKFSDKKWQAWDARVRASKDYDWRRHSGSDAEHPGKNANQPKK